MIPFTVDQKKVMEAAYERLVLLVEQGDSLDNAMGDIEHMFGLNLFERDEVRKLYLREHPDVVEAKPVVPYPAERARRLIADMDDTCWTEDIVVGWPFDDD